jgi:hypothetical protein
MGFEACQDKVEAMMRVGESFRSVEAAIEGANIAADEKAALWLLAWSMRNDITQAQDARAMLAGLSVIAD